MLAPVLVVLGSQLLLSVDACIAQGQMFYHSRRFANIADGHVSADEKLDTGRPLLMPTEELIPLKHLSGCSDSLRIAHIRGSYLETYCVIARCVSE